MSDERSERRRYILEYQISNELLNMGLVMLSETIPRIILTNVEEEYGYFVFKCEDYDLQGKFTFSSFVIQPTDKPEIHLNGYKLKDIEILNDV